MYVISVYVCELELRNEHSSILNIVKYLSIEISNVTTLR